MLIEQLNPILLKCSFYDGYQMIEEKQTSPRKVYDYEIEYFITSGGGVVCDGVYYATNNGDIIVRKPGTITFAVQPVKTFLLCLDFCGNISKQEGYVTGTPDKMHPILDSFYFNDVPTYIESEKNENAALLIQKIHECFIYNSDYDKIALKANLLLLINELYYRTHTASKRTSIYNKKIRNSVGYIAENFSEELDVAKLIEQSGLSKAHFHKLFKDCTTYTPIQYITKIRLEKAQNLLLTSSSEISQIASLCGYDNPIYFSQVFKKNIGISPREFRQTYDGNTLQTEDFI